MQALLALLALIADSSMWSDRAGLAAAAGVVTLPLLPLAIVARAPSLLAGIVFFGFGTQVFLISAAAGPLAVLIPLSDLLLCWLAAQLGLVSVRLMRVGR